jgi:hypothetical protein
MLMMKISYQFLCRTVPRSCYHLKKLDVRKSGKYLIDPDGPDHGDPPVEAHCDMKTGKTIIYVELKTLGGFMASN